MRRTVALLVALVAVMLLAACAESTTTNDNFNENRKTAVSGRNDVFNRAKSLYPDPLTQLQNFPLREALVKMALRQDEKNHPWYVYILGDNGNTIGYYVAQTVPINACNFLSSSQETVETEGADLLTQAPSLDGMYYGTAQCDAWFFFDYATDALIQIRGVNFYSADQQMILDAEPIVVAEP